jgi:AmmeMemoRadiSam system protein A
MATQEHSEEDLKLLHRLACLAVQRAVEDFNLLAYLSVSTDEELLRSVAGLAVADIPGVLQEPAGAFVTIKRVSGGEQPVLRGCKGSITATGPLFGVVLRSSVKAAVDDTRFHPVEARELDHLTVAISVLTSPSPISHWEEYEPGRHGVILTKGSHRAVFLPEVPIEHGFSREQALSRLAVKAGLGPNAWRHGCSYDVFSTQVLARELRTPEGLEAAVGSAE